MRAEQVAAWWTTARPGLRRARAELRPPSGGGYSNEVVVATLRGERGGTEVVEDLVVRMVPDGPGLFPTHDLDMEAAVQEAATVSGVPVASPVEVVHDPAHFGRPALVMPYVAGRVPGELPVADEWLMGLRAEDQRRLEGGMLSALAGVHSMVWRGTRLEELLPGADGLHAEVGRWTQVCAEMFDGGLPAPLSEAFDRCAGAVPEEFAPPSVLWGDVRLGNLVVGEDLAVRAVLDWEMAGIGPAEVDLAWYLALDGLATHFVGSRPPGLRSHDEVVAAHSATLGRPMEHMEWFEAWALVRAAALNLRTEHLGARAAGTRAPSAEANAVVARVLEVTRTTLPR